jgi:uncharacterized tellurite resistance protein B-like protein
MKSEKSQVTMHEEPPIRGERLGAGDAPAAGFRLATLAPLVMVAWADGAMDASERAEVQRIAARRGILEGTEAHRELLRWLEQEPAPEIYTAATRTIEEALRLRPRHEAATLAHDLHERTTEVAQASRSYWGLGPRVSPDEQRVVEMLEQHIRPFTYPILKS